MAPHDSPLNPSAAFLLEDERLGAWLSRLLDDDSSQASLADDLERAVLGSSRRSTRAEVARRTGVDRERSTRLWRALGFADVDDDEAVFTEADIEAIASIDSLVDSGVIDPAVEAAAARAAGQSLSRLAEWEIALLGQYVLAKVSAHHVDLDRTTVLRDAERLLEAMEQLHSYVWRRHVAALIGRALARAPDEVASTTLAVGFADVVGYTRLSRQLPEHQLAAMLEQFESAAMEEIGRADGRLVKLLGDAVLFATTSAACAATIAIDLARRMELDPALPSVRIGLAWGRVLRRFGDVYGPVVNVASRLTSAAEPGQVLVDEQLASALAPDSGFSVQALAPRSVGGYSNLVPWRLSRSGATSDQRCATPPA